MAINWTTHGSEFPYDQSRDWEGNTLPYTLGDWAHRAALGVLANLGDRRGIKQELRKVDREVREEIVKTLADIIRDARANHGET